MEDAIASAVNIVFRRESAMKILDYFYTEVTQLLSLKEVGSFLHKVPVPSEI